MRTTTSTVPLTPLAALAQVATSAPLGQAPVRAVVTGVITRMLGRRDAAYLTPGKRDNASLKWVEFTIDRDALPHVMLVKLCKRMAEVEVGLGHVDLDCSSWRPPAPLEWEEAVASTGPGGVQKARGGGATGL
ncbi:hypothetical protein PLESTB_000870500 [Pleodorina starrii]|uniref:Uncharacterized protein n=1 Tax=Pleodorina starrii TaxID=330485 RepID=A0A9W6BN91_9CHLO|nr:hypothetical protein PLESTB_000870500 [Pleodorina starrii]GLC76155.1 hypothetical protein PLESTF_001740700 [Pleodorina starrii]